MTVYAWLIDFGHFRENSPTGIISEWTRKVTEHNEIIQYSSQGVSANMPRHFAVFSLWDHSEWFITSHFRSNLDSHFRCWVQKKRTKVKQIRWPVRCLRFGANLDAYLNKSTDIWLIDWLINYWYCIIYETPINQSIDQMSLFWPNMCPSLRQLLKTYRSAYLCKKRIGQRVFFIFIIFSKTQHQKLESLSGRWFFSEKKSLPARTAGTMFLNESMMRSDFALWK